MTRKAVKRAAVRCHRRLHSRIIFFEPLECRVYFAADLHLILVAPKLVDDWSPSALSAEGEATLSSVEFKAGGNKIVIAPLQEMGPSQAILPPADSIQPASDSTPLEIANGLIGEGESLELAASDHLLLGVDTDALSAALNQYGSIRLTFVYPDGYFQTSSNSPANSVLSEPLPERINVLDVVATNSGHMKVVVSPPQVSRFDSSTTEVIQSQLNQLFGNGQTRSRSSSIQANNSGYLQTIAPTFDNSALTPLVDNTLGQQLVGQQLVGNNLRAAPSSPTDSVTELTVVLQPDITTTTQLWTAQSVVFRRNEQKELQIHSSELPNDSGSGLDRDLLHYPSDDSQPQSTSGRLTTSNLPPSEPLLARISLQQLRSSHKEGISIIIKTIELAVGPRKSVIKTEDQTELRQDRPQLAYFIDKPESLGAVVTANHVAVVENRIPLANSRLNPADFLLLNIGEIGSALAERDLGANSKTEQSVSNATLFVDTALIDLDDLIQQEQSAMMLVSADVKPWIMTPPDSATFLPKEIVNRGDESVIATDDLLAQWGRLLSDSPITQVLLVAVSTSILPQTLPRDRLSERNSEVCKDRHNFVWASRVWQRLKVMFH